MLLFTQVLQVDSSAILNSVICRPCHWAVAVRFHIVYYPSQLASGSIGPHKKALQTGIRRIQDVRATIGWTSFLFRYKRESGEIQDVRATIEWAFFLFCFCYNGTLRLMYFPDFLLTSGLIHIIILYLFVRG
jgi:hypothetical protein